MATHPHMLIAYDDAGNVVGTLDYLVQYDADKRPLGLVDFAAHEEAGGAHLDVWKLTGESNGVPWNAKGSKVWPEWLGGKAHDFRVELDGPPGEKRIVALVHKDSGHRRERGAIEAAILDRVRKANGKPADIRDLVGGPDRPVLLKDDGTNETRQTDVPPLPLLGADLPRESA